MKIIRLWLLLVTLVPLVAEAAVLKTSPTFAA